MTRRKHSASFKARVALEAIKSEMPIAQIATKHQVHPTQVQEWKSATLSRLAELFEKNGKANDSQDDQLAALERKVGQLTIENDFLKKSWSGYVKRIGDK